MHFLKIIHGDVKNDNLMYSPSFGKPVFIDFNCSRVVKEPIGCKTLTKFKGTQSYCYSEMKNLFNQTIGYADLFYNDAYGLYESLKRFKYDELEKTEE